MMTKPLPSASYLHQRLDYNPITGECFWLPRYDDTQAARRWNTMFAGKRVGAIDSEGYLTTAIDGKPYKLHRLIWKMTFGDDPAPILDHEHGVKSDNRIVELREASASQNAMNRRTPMKGVCWSERNQCWQAQIERDGKQIWLGYHDTEEAGKAAYDAAASDLFGAFAGSS